MCDRISLIKLVAFFEFTTTGKILGLTEQKRYTWQIYDLYLWYASVILSSSRITDHDIRGIEYKAHDIYTVAAWETILQDAGVTRDSKFDSKASLARI